MFWRYAEIDFSRLLKIIFAQNFNIRQILNSQCFYRQMQTNPDINTWKIVMRNF